MDINIKDIVPKSGEKFGEALYAKSVCTPKINALLHGQGTGSKVVRVARDLKDRGDLKSIDFIQIYFFKNVLRTVSAI